MDLRDAYDPFRALGGAWKLVQRAPLTLIVGGVLLFLTDAKGAESVRVEDGHVYWLGALLAGGVVLGCCCLGVVLWLVNTLLHPGVARAVRRALAGEEERFGDLWAPGSLFGPLVLARLIKVVLRVLVTLPFVVMIGGPIAVGQWVDLEVPGVLLGVLFGLCYLPLWAYVQLGLLLVEEGVAFDRLPPLKAVERSWELARGNRIQLLLYGVVLAVVGFAGVCLCLVGVLATGPWTRLAWFESYARLTEGASAGAAAPTGG